MDSNKRLFNNVNVVLSFLSDGSPAMSRNDRSPRHRPIALGLGTAAGGLLAAALIPMTSASAVPPDIDPYTDLGFANPAPLDVLLPASFAAQLDTFIDADGINYADNDFFADLLGPSGSAIDTAFFNLDLGPIDAIWDQLSGL
jgi:hypothetical protein